MAVALTLLALLIELIVGYPDWLVRAIGHPVTWIGRLIGMLDAAWNRAGDRDGRRRAMGVLAVLLVVIVIGLAALAAQRGLLAQRVPGGTILIGGYKYHEGKLIVAISTR